MEKENGEIKEFKKIFNEIRNLGYVKAVNNYNSGIGLTFENLLGKKADNFPLPDFHNIIEIKTKLAFSKTPVHLFSLTPEGNNFFETKNILEKYGYYREKDKINKVFNGTIFANKMCKIGFFYYFLLKIDYKEEKIKILIYDINKKLIDSSIYWNFNKVENAFHRKIKYLSLIQVWSTKRNGTIYYKYYKYDIYKYSNFYTFLYLIDKGIISVTFSINIYADKKRYGQMHDHGTTFDIDKNDLNKLFFKI